MRMYELYKYKWTTILFPGGIFLIPVVCFPYGAYRDYQLKGFSFNTVMFIIMTIFFALIFVAIVLGSKVDPYEAIKKWKERDPELVQEMEYDYETAAALGYKMWKGNRFYFFKGEDFWVIPIGQIESITVQRRYRRAIGPFYKCIFTSAEGSVKLNIPFLIQKKEVTMALLQQLALESGIDLQIL